jgi:hypothetical protein
MAPFYAGALLAYWRLIETKAAKFAVLAGALAGVAFLAKYAAIYLALGAVLATILPTFRPGLRNAALALLAFLVVASPNLVWNATHGFATVGHTMDNVGWVKETEAPALNPVGMVEFVLAQFLVFGPVLFGALLWSLRSTDRTVRALALFALPVVAVVTVQALLSRAYANWAVAAYFPGTVAAVLVLIGRPGLLRVSLVFGLAASLAVPAAIVAGPLIGGGDRPLLHRYLGRADLSREAIGIAKFQGASAIVSSDRDVLADLFYTGRNSGLSFYAVPTTGAPKDYYEEMHMLPPDAKGLMLAILARPPVCDGRTMPALHTFDTSEGAHFKRNYAAYLIGANCLTGND